MVDSYAEALKREPVRGLRHSIIHANIPTDHALDAMAAMQRDFDAGYPESSPSFTWWIGDTYAGNFGPERSLRLNPFASFGKRGIRWAGGSDYFVTPFPARYGIWAAIAREPLLGIVRRRIPSAARKRWTRTPPCAPSRSAAAHQMFMDGRVGSLEPGKRADIAVWDTDFYAAPAAAIKDAACQMTMLDGDVVYRSDGFR